MRAEFLFAIEVFVGVVLWLAVNLPFDALMEIAPKRQFFLDDHSIGYAHVEEQIGLWLLDGLNAIACAIAVVLEGFMMSWKCAGVLFGCLVTANGPTQAVSNLLKIFVARLRPDFLARCQPDPITLECTNPDTYTINNGRTSFPSGHCVSVWFWYGFLALYLAKRLRILNLSKRDGLLSLRIFAVCCPVLVCLYVSAERNTDNRHHFGDIVAGSLIGIAGAVLALCMLDGYYRQMRLVRRDVAKDVEETFE